MAQISNKTKGAAGAVAAIVIALPVVMQWEGVSLRVIKDRLAYDIPTGCYGETVGVKLGEVYTIEQCAEKLKARLPEYNDGISKCIKRTIPDKVRGALISLAYNIGVAGVCKSTALRKINAGDYRGGCDAFLMWVNSGGKFRQGLLNRRQAERQLCLEGL